MDNLHLKALRYFSDKPHGDEKAANFLLRAYEPIQKSLSDSSDPEVLREKLEELEIFINHVSDLAIDDLRNCWSRLNKLFGFMTAMGLS